MEILVSTEQRYQRTPDGTYWASGGLSYDFWCRYLEVFDEVLIFARALSTRNVRSDMVRADGPNVRFAPVPYYVGPAEFLRVANRVLLGSKRAVEASPAVMMRVPSLLATTLEWQLRKTKRPFGVEVVGDPDRVFASTSIGYPLRRFLRNWMRRAQQRQCWNAAGASYVTDHVLQSLYPCKASTTSVSDVEITDGWLADRPRGFSLPSSTKGPDSNKYQHPIHDRPKRGPGVRLIFVGSLEQLYKGPDLAIRAMALLAGKDQESQLVMIGGGRYLATLERLADALRVRDRIIFRGMLSNPGDVRKELDAADLFILPSRTEGLPRALIEAMARGLPCIGTDVGGIPELLAPEDMVRPNDYQALAGKIREVISSKLRMLAMSERNLKKGREFASESLKIKRNEFYRKIRIITEEWLKVSEYGQRPHY